MRQSLPNKYLQAALFCLALFIPSIDISAQVISSHFFGQNAWMPDTIGTKVLGGKLHRNWAKVGESGARLVRFGGISADRERPTNYQYIKMIDSIRAHGMEPIIQVSYHDGDFTASQAAQLVQFINGTSGRNIKYWSIGNEPDLEYGYTSASQVAAYIKPFASAMKAADSTIKIIGPETAWYNTSIINGLTTPGGQYDITGTDPAGRYYVDIISFHTYPYSGSQTRSQMIDKLTASPGYDTYLGSLSARVASCNIAHGRTGANALKTAVTELNVNYQNSSADNLNGTGVNSFIGAQFLAEMYGLGMKNGVDIMTMWSVIEGNSTALNIGYLDRTTGNKKPIYHHFKMMADHFSGNYITSSDNQTNVKVFSSQNSSLTTVLIMNQDATTSFGYAVRLDNAANTATNALKINVHANIPQMYYNTIPVESSVLLQFNPQGAIVKKVTYTIAQALAGTSPTVSVYNQGGPLTLSQPVNNTPGGALAFCSGAGTSLTATSGTNSITWFASATSSLVLATGSVFATPTLTTGTTSSQVTFYAQASNSATVSARTPITLTVNPKPVISAGSGAICAGDIFTLTPSGASSYTYSSGSATVSPSSNTSYSITGTSAAGCEAQTPAIAHVTVNARPVIAVNSGSICAGSTFTMIPSGASSYTFSGGSAAVSPSASGTYSVYGTNTAGCASSSPAIAQVTVHALPVVAVNSGSICAGEVFTLAPSGATSYTFSSGSPTVSPAFASSYSVIGKSSAGCISTPAIATVAVHQAPSITVNSGAICAGDIFTLSPTGADSYTFSSGTSAVSPAASTSYTILGSAAGCTAVSQAIAHVTVNGRPVIAVNSGSICAGNAFTMTPSGASSYTFSNGSPVASPLYNTSYSVTGTSSEGCESSAPAVANVTVQALPVILVSGGSICKGSYFTLSPTGATSYTFSSGSPVVSPNSATTYTVWGEAAGCTGLPAVALVTIKSRKLCNTGKENLSHAGKDNEAGEDTIPVVSNKLIVVDSANISASEEEAQQGNDVVTGISGSSDAHSLLIYPNPSSGDLNINVEEESTFSLMNISGIVLRSAVLAPGTTHLDISDLPTGIYVIAVRHGDKVEVARVIKR